MHLGGVPNALEATMLAILAAIFFLIALLLDWTSATQSTLVNFDSLLLLGLICLALHLAGIGSSVDWRSRGTYRRRRR